MVWRQAIIWTNAELLSVTPLETNFSQVLFELQNFFIQENAFENVVWKVSASLENVSHFYLGLNVLIADSSAFKVWHPVGTPRSCRARPTRVCARWPVLVPGIRPVLASQWLVLVRRATTTAQRSTRRSTASDRCVERAMPRVALVFVWSDPLFIN